MKNKSKIICIDGPSSIGKTVQCNLLKIHLQEMGIKTHIIKITKDDSLQNVADKFQEAEQIIEKNILGNIVLIDGGMAGIVAEAMAKGSSANRLPEDIRNTLRLVEQINLRGFVQNIVMIPKNYKFVFLRNPNQDEFIFSTTVDGIRNFANLHVTINFPIKYITINPEDTMLIIRNEILKNILKNS
jgi:hypothetical protein